MMLWPGLAVRLCAGRGVRHGGALAHGAQARERRGKHPGVITTPWRTRFALLLPHPLDLLGLVLRVAVLGPLLADPVERRLEAEGALDPRAKAHCGTMTWGSTQCRHTVEQRAKAGWEPSHQQGGLRALPQASELTLTTAVQAAPACRLRAMPGPSCCCLVPTGPPQVRQRCTCCAAGQPAGHHHHHHIQQALAPSLPALPSCPAAHLRACGSWAAAA